MIQQQNLVEEFLEQPLVKSMMEINKIDLESMKLRALVSHLKVSPKRYEQNIEFYNESELSNIDHKSQKYSFDLELPSYIPEKREFSLSRTRPHNQRRHQEDLGIKSKPKSTINGRDDIRIRKINNKIIESFSTREHGDQFTEALQEFESQHSCQSQSHNGRTDSYLPQQLLNNSQKTQLSNKNNWRINKKKISNKSSKTQNIGKQQHQDEINPEQFIDRVSSPAILNYLKQRQDQFPTSSSVPHQLYRFFNGIISFLGLKDAFKEPLIKKYHNCLYFGQQFKQRHISTYKGLIWYYRKVFYWGQFLNGKKNGYGVQINLEEIEEQSIWKGTFLNGKKTGYFTLWTPNLEYNGGIKNSLMDGQGHLKTKNSTYQGRFEKGMKHGQGTENFHHRKAHYHGSYLNNKFQGTGIFESTNYYFKGDFKNGLFHGNGYEKTKSMEYIGQFKNGKKNGRGIIKKSNGQIIKGIFKDGEITYEENFDQLPHQENQYVRSIPIQSAQHNHQYLSPNQTLSKQQKQKSPLTHLKERRKLYLQKTKEQRGLDQLQKIHEERTIEQRQWINRQPDENEPLDLKILPAEK